MTYYKRKPQPTMALQTAIIQVLWRRTNGTVSSIHAELHTEERWRSVSESEVRVNLDKLMEYRKDVTRDGLWFSCRTAEVRS